MWKKCVLGAFRVIFVKYTVVSMGWYFRDVHPGRRNVRSIKGQMTKLWSELIGIMGEKRRGKRLQAKIAEVISFFFF